MLMLRRVVSKEFMFQDTLLVRKLAGGLGKKLPKNIHYHVSGHPEELYLSQIGDHIPFTLSYVIRLWQQ